jgi:hypothetical protein
MARQHDEQSSGVQANIQAIQSMLDEAWPGLEAEMEQIRAEMEWGKLQGVPSYLERNWQGTAAAFVRAEEYELGFHSQEKGA